tara:strand:- start:329 stop:535 length:207 start_codon:yes stop_codon:yes gene_type:complete
MSNIDRQITNMENHIFTIELAMESAMTRKEQEELGRKHNKFNKKLRKLKRKSCSENRDTSERTGEDWL